MFSRAAVQSSFERLFTFEAVGGYSNWISLMLVSMIAIVVLPRQFQVLVVENVDEHHIKKAIWLFPLYLLLINLFVLPIALGGSSIFQENRRRRHVCAHLPMAEHFPAPGAVRVHRRALCRNRHDHRRDDCPRHHGVQRLRHAPLAAVRAPAPVGPHGSHRPHARHPPGRHRLRHFAGVRLCPADRRVLRARRHRSHVVRCRRAVCAGHFGGILWKGATRLGALAGLCAGFLVWIYTLLLPSFARSGWISQSFLYDGPWGIALLSPYALLGLSGLDPIAHALFWTMAINVGLYVAVSLFAADHDRAQPSRAVRGYFQADVGGCAHLAWQRHHRRPPPPHDRFVGEVLTDQAFHRFERDRGRRLRSHAADADIVHYAERRLAGAIGAASARIMIASVLKEEMHDIDEVMQILDEASQLVVYSRQLEEKSQQLEAATAELRAANERLKELDKMKDDFVSTISHEFRTPLSSIRSFSEIVHDNPDITVEQRQKFLNIIVQETDRLTRLVNDILDLAKMEAGHTDWHLVEIEPTR